MSRPAEQSFGGGAGLLLAAGSLLAAIVSVLLSFRVPFPAFDLPLQANTGRMLAAAAAGMALAAAAAVRDPSRRPLREAYVFALSVGGAGGLVLGLVYAGGEFAAVGLGAVGAGAAMALVRLVDGHRRIANAGLALVLVALFFAAIPAYLAASTDVAGLGGAAIWLLGDVSRAHGAGAVAVLLLAVVGCAWVAWCAEAGRGGSATVSSLLVGLGVGIAGPVAFVGWAGSSLARYVAGPAAPASRRIVLSAVAGAALLMLADAVARRLVGGYAPPLNVTIAFVAIPAFLWWNRRRLRREAGGGGGWLSGGFEAAVIAVIGAGLMAFAYAFTAYVRLAT